MVKKTVAYLLAEFPSQTETFILKEAFYMNKSFPLYIIVLRKGKIRPDDRIREAFGDRLIYISFRNIIKYLPYAFTAPESSNPFRGIRKGVKKSLHRLRIFMVSSYIADRIKHLPIGHIHAHFAGYPADTAFMVSLFSGIPFSFTAHANDIYINAEDMADRIRQAAFVATCTKYNKDRLETAAHSEDRGRIHLAYHGVDLNYWQYRKPNPPNGQVYILSIGRLIEKKGFIYLLEAARKLTEKGISVQLHIPGKGKDERKLKRYCRKNHLERIVTFPGWQSPEQIKQSYVRSDIFALPSIIASDGDRDGIPNVILEAMAVGLPVVTTPVSGIPEVIRHGYNGLLVPEKNGEQLAQAILDLLADNALRISLIENARNTIVQKFDNNDCNVFLKELFETALAESTGTM